MSTTKAEKAFTFREGGKVKLYQKDDELSGAALAHAQAHRDRLTRRELLFMEGAEATLDDAPRAVERFRLLASLYPDDYRARYNEAYFAHFDLLRGDEARRAMKGADVPQNAQRPAAVYLMASIELAMGEVDAALALFERSVTLGVRGSLREYVDAYSAKRRYVDARRISALQSPVGLPGQDIESRYHEASLPLDQGDWQAALDAPPAPFRRAHAGPRHADRRAA